MLSPYCFSQNPALPLDSATGKVSYVSIGEVPGASKQVLYARALEWVAKSYGSAQDVIQMQDKEAGKIIVKGNTRSTFPNMGGAFGAGIFEHTLSIACKEGRYRVEFTDFTHRRAGADADVVSMGPVEREKGAGVLLVPNTRQWQQMKQDLAKRMSDVFLKLKAAMSETTEKEW